MLAGRPFRFSGSIRVMRAVPACTAPLEVTTREPSARSEGMPQTMNVPNASARASMAVSSTTPRDVSAQVNRMATSGTGRFDEVSTSPMTTKRLSGNCA